MRTRRSAVRLPHLPHVLSIVALAATSLVIGPALADDGPMVRKPVSRTPDMESERALLSMMQFYVRATRASGEETLLEYFADRDGDNKPDELVETREYAKPLVVSYFDEVPEDDGGGITIFSGVELSPELRRDAWVSISLDDGDTWKERNVSESALETSFTLANGIEYPGDVPEVVHAVAGNQILVAWTSKYCSQGSPRYSVKDELDVDGDGDVEEPLYVDLFDVAGNQGSIDYTEWMHHGEYPFAHVGEIPFSCVWTARGTVEMVQPGQGSEIDVPVWGIRWRKPERLTSGKRDAYYIAAKGVEGAGFTITWQEDPEGLRPGYGEGPGIGWSGATVNHKTDIWYSHIGWDDFPVMEDPEGNPTLDPSVLDTNKPKPYERMAMPLRISDNYNCLADRVDSDGVPHPGFCFEDFNGNGVADFCAEVYAWVNAQGETKQACITEDGRLLNGQVGASRARLDLKGYTRADGTRSAWVILAYEETKGLGAGHTDEEPLDIGKDVMYHSFDMFLPDIAAPGHMLNLPETDPTSDPENPTLLPMLVNDSGELQYPTTIGRRPSLIVQPPATIAPGGTSALVLYKDGYERQGGPSDIFMRRFVVPADFDPAVDNPYAIANLTCDVADTAIVATSPSAYPPAFYPNGVCLRGAANLSSTNPLTFEALDNGDPQHGITERVLTWEQTTEDLGDEAWENKYEVAKGHRGFIDGDFVMVMYAWSPNWLATSKGHEPYNLYIRRSFDGGLTWTTTPAALGGTGTTYEQTFGVGERKWTVSRSLAAGEFEPARNVSQLTSSKETVLDPRYSPTNIGTQSPVNRVLLADGTYAEMSLYADDYVRDPSRFFAVFETGDATTVEEGEAEPLDLFYSRATGYGDFWDSSYVYAQGQGDWEERWDWLENKKDVLSGEASVAGSPGGDFLWVVWNQWMEHEDGTIYESDPIFRRLWWDDVTISVEAGDYAAAEGDLVTVSAYAVYDGDEALVYSWDLDGDGDFESEGDVVDVRATGAMQGAAVRVCDPMGRCAIDRAWINRGVHGPRVWKVEVVSNPAQVGDAVELSARFTDPGPEVGTHEATIDWGDGTVELAAIASTDDGNGPALATGSHVYASSGLYTVRVTVADDEGNVGWDDLLYAIVYDPMAGSVRSNTVRFRDPGGAGVAQLTFEAAYAGADAVPTGRIEFLLGDLVFVADALEWLVIDGDRVFLRGSGLVDGKQQQVLVSAVDGAPDRVRVRIWQGRNRAPLYDSQPDAPDDAPATTPTLRGSKITLVGVGCAPGHGNDGNEGRCR